MSDEATPPGPTQVIRPKPITGTFQAGIPAITAAIFAETGKATDKLHEEERDTRTKFLEERIAALPVNERPADKEREDLDRRLIAAVEALRLPTAKQLVESMQSSLLVTSAVHALTNALIGTPETAQLDPSKDGPTIASLARPSEGCDAWINGTLTYIPAATPTPTVKTAERRLRLALVWSKVFREWREEYAATFGTRIFLELLVNDGSDDKALAQRPEAELRLAAAVEEALRSAREAIGPLPHDRELEQLAESNKLKLLAVAEQHAKYLERRGAGALPLARHLREKEAARLAEWLNQGTLPGIQGGSPPWERWKDSIYFARYLASICWKDGVRDRLRREQQKPPALVTAAFDDMFNGIWKHGRALRAAGSGADLVDSSGSVIANVPTLPAEGLEAVQRWIKRLGTLTGHRAIRALIIDGHRAVLAQEPEASVRRYKGGLPAFVERIGAGSKKAQSEMRDVLRAGQDFRFTWAGGEIGGLWTYALQDRTGPGKHAELEVRLGAPLLPQYVHTLPKTSNRMLVPIVELPAFVGRERDHAAQAAYQARLVRALLEQRDELGTHGGALLTDDDLDRMAGEVGLPLSTRAKVLDRWCQDGSDAPAFLERVGSSRFHLADNTVYRDARAFLDEAGKLTRKRRRQGQNAAKARRHGRTLPP